MLCPFCLDDVQFILEKGYFCPECNEQVPPMYVRGYKEFPPLVVSAVGLRGHGKTVYFASLFYLLKESPLSAFWQPDFFALSLSDRGGGGIMGFFPGRERRGWRVLSPL